MIAMFSCIPVGKNESLAKDLAGAIDIIAKSGIDYQITAMGTIVEGDFDEIMNLIKKCHNEVKKKAPRVDTKITIDDREGVSNRLKGKVADIEKILGYEVKK